MRMTRGILVGARRRAAAVAALAAFAAGLAAAGPRARSAELPHLRRQGTATHHLRLEPGRFSMQRIRLYRYQ